MSVDSADVLMFSCGAHLKNHQFLVATVNAFSEIAVLTPVKTCLGCLMSE
jgi:hypothetical protein